MVFSVDSTFSVDLADLNVFIPSDYQLLNGYQFTLRQIPTIPEPTTLTLTGLALAGLSFKRRKAA